MRRENRSCLPKPLIGKNPGGESRLIYGLLIAMGKIDPNQFRFLEGGGEMGQLIRSFNWAKSSLGPITSWPQSLKTSISLMMNSQHPIWIGWGPDASFLYNDAYIQVLSLAKHPWALGRPAAEVWKEIWHVCGPLADKVFQRGEPSFVNDVRLFMRRKGYLEETFYSFSYSPIRDESGSVGGLFCPSTEVTAKVLNDRRLRTLLELGTGSLVEKSAEAACSSAASVLAKNQDDVPFALLYLMDQGGESLSLKESVGIPFGDPFVSPPTIELAHEENGSHIWPIRDVVTARQSRALAIHKTESFPLGAAHQPVSEALVLPLISRGQERPLGILISGVNPARKLDADYRAFFEFLAGHITTAIQNARAAEEEKRRVDKLAELDRAKTVFFSNVSHELRTPLMLMLGPLEDEMKMRPGPQERLELAHRNSLRLLKLVNTLLDFSRIEAGRMELSFEPTDLAVFTAELASVFRSSAEKAGLKLMISCPPLPGLVFVDRDMWEKIIFNLLSNALKFTLRGEIELRLSAQTGEDGNALPAAGVKKNILSKDNPPSAKSVVLTVRDTGTGIPASELPRIFERFHRVKNPQSRSHEGTGIGLALVQELTRLHGGNISVESAEGSGTIFTVRLPMGSSHLPQDRIGSKRNLFWNDVGVQPFVNEIQRWLPVNNPAKGIIARDSDDDRRQTVDPNRSEFKTADFGMRDGKGMQILLADDNSDMREYIQRLLVEHGYEVMVVSNGAEALREIQHAKPDLVLSDVMMPFLDGFGLLRELRNDPNTSTIPIILISARAGEESRLEGVEAGADDYLTKPFSARELIARVSTHLKLARIRREAKEMIAEKEERLRAIYDGTQEYIGLLTVDGILLETNRASLTFANIQRDEVIGKPFWETAWFQYTPGAPVAVRKAIKRASLGEFVRFETDIITPADEARVFSVSFHPIRNRNGEVIFVVPESRDITDLKQGEKAVREINLQLQTVLSSITDGLAVLDKNWHYTYFNEQGAHIIGMRPEQLIGRSVWELFPHAKSTRFYECYHQAVATGQSVQFEEFYPEPLNKWLECRCYPSNEGLSVYFHDITERKRAEMILRQNEALFSALVNLAPTGVYVVDGQFKLQQINARAMPAFEKVTPRIGRDFSEVMEILWGPELSKDIVRIFRHTLATGERYISPRFSEFRQDLGEERAYEWEIQRMTLPDGQHGVVCYFNDITEVVRAETTLRDAKLAAETANRSKDHFLAALSHELRTPLTPVLMTAATLSEDMRLPAGLREQLRMMERNIALEARLIDDLLDISGIATGKLHLHLQLCDAHALIELAMEIVRDTALTKEISLQCVLNARRRFIMTDPARFQQVIWNLLRNAVKFTARGGKISIRTYEEPVEHNKSWLNIEVADSGIGIEPNSLEKIFQPFEQGPATGNHRFGGMGLGLAIARAIVDLHGGKISALSPGANMGATFRVELPDAIEVTNEFIETSVNSKPTVDQPERKQATRKLNRLLIVEDHAATLQVLTSLLTRSGFEAIGTSNVAEALLAASQNSFDLVISDLGLPDGTGIQLMEQLRADYGLKGIALTGYGMEEDIARAQQAGFIAHLIKPVQINELRRVLAEFN